MYLLVFDIVPNRKSFFFKIKLRVLSMLLCLYSKQIVDQESLEAVEEAKGAVVFCVAACFGKVGLIDNMEINV